jgi:undecaprenyl-diphosphatase
MVLFALSTLIVLLIAVAQHEGWVHGIDRSLMGAAGHFREGPITPIMKAASIVGDTGGRIAMTLAAMGWLLWKRRRGDALWLLAVVIGGTLLNTALKQVFAAPRPDLLPHLDIVRSYSFPSGHAAGNMIFFGALAMLWRNRFVLMLSAFAILLIGVSRVWLGVHWPSDVLAGWVEGLGWLALWGALHIGRVRAELHA